MIFKNKLKHIIKHKKIAILGFGKEGQSTYRLLKSLFPKREITIIDQNISCTQNTAFTFDDKTHFIFGDNYLEALQNFDLIFKSPGISLKGLKHLNKAHITSQADVFLSFYAKQTIGITGTKGKSTTTSLIHYILENAGKEVVLVGNMGIPPFDIIDKIKNDTFIVYELSSHQLEYIQYAPHISILLNIYQEHLDHYKSYKDYQNAKLNIAKFQSEDDIFIFNYDHSLVKKRITNSPIKSCIYPYSLKTGLDTGCFISQKDIFFKENNNVCRVFDTNMARHIQGRHNLSNILSAILACKKIGISDDKIKEGIAGFKGLAHRLEYVGCFGNKHFYNDSIATIPEATIEAIKTLKNVSTVIVGGFDRGISYDLLIKYLEKSAIEHVVLLGKAGERIQKSWANPGKRLYLFSNFDKAVLEAIQLTRKGSICLLSPAAASYDMFKDFAERGMRFKQIVKNEAV